MPVPDFLLEDFDFALPPERIALRPAVPRDASRLLVVDPARQAKPLSDHVMRDLPSLLCPGDMLVLNDTKVLPAQLYGHRGARAGAGEQPLVPVALTLFEPQAEGAWRAFAKPARRLAPGDRIILAGEGKRASLLVLDKQDDGTVTVASAEPGIAIEAIMLDFGLPPLPPYIASRRAADETDRQDYQTTYAAREGAVAAPTAGLHFTPDLFRRLDEMGVRREFITLHVGAGTFLPVKTERLADHKMHVEWGEISETAANAINAARQSGGRIVAVGTTALRLLESAAMPDGTIAPFSGSTGIFITPGTPIRSADLLLTNFHLPKSTLFMLVCAFSGIEGMKQAYAHAVESGYRFYSYGDACLLHRAPFADLPND